MYVQIMNKNEKEISDKDFEEKIKKRYEKAKNSGVFTFYRVFPFLLVFFVGVLSETDKLGSNRSEYFIFTLIFCLICIIFLILGDIKFHSELDSSSADVETLENAGLFDTTEENLETIFNALKIIKEKLKIEDLPLEKAEYEFEKA